MDKDSKIVKVEVVDDNNNVLISMNYNKVEYDKKFDNDYFNLNSIIKTNNEKQENSNTNSNELKDSKINNSNTDDIVKEKENGANEKKSQDSNTTNNNNSPNTNDQSNNNSSSDNTNNNDKLETKETLSIEDIIYPMYLPNNTYLTSQERIDTENGERLILTFGGDNSFVLVEETISKNNDNLVIPVSGEFDFLSNVIGIIGTNSVTWHSNGIEYYITSNTLETSVLVDIARSISILPVSK